MLSNIIQNDYRTSHLSYEIESKKKMPVSNKYVQQKCFFAVIEIN